MSAALLTAGLVVCVISLVIFGIKAAQKGGERRGVDRERADRLAESAERRAKAERVAAAPVDPRRVRDLWARYRRRVSNTEGG